MPYEGFIESRDEQGEKIIVPLFVETNSLGYIFNPIADDTAEVISFHCSEDDKIKVYLTRLGSEDLSGDEENPPSFRFDPMPGHAQLLGEATPLSSPIRIVFDLGMSLSTGTPFSLISSLSAKD
jgi:hypothetical protein